MQLALLTTLLLNAATAHSAEIVTDEAMKLHVLRLVFPNAQISAVPARPDEPYSVTDPLGHLVITLRNGLEVAHAYEVVGPVAKDEEMQASDILRPIRERRFSDKREVRMVVYRWKSPGGGEPLLVAVLNYSFPEANPARCCLAIGKVLLLSGAADRVLDGFDKMPHAFTIFTSIKFLAVDRSGTEELMISVNTAGAPSFLGVNSAIFDLSNRNLTPVLSVDTTVFDEGELDDLHIHTLTLDERQTARAKGRRFFFVKRSFAEKAKLFAKPLVTTESYPAGAGLPIDWLQ